MPEGSPDPLFNHRSILSQATTTIIVTLVIAIIGGLGTLILNSFTKGGLIHLLGGVTTEELNPEYRLPKGTILYVDDAQGCKALGANWEDAGLGGRFLVGATNSDPQWNYRHVGGSSDIKLKGENMPILYVTQIDVKAGGGGTKIDIPLYVSFDGAHGGSGSLSTEAYGKNSVPIETLPPYSALYACRRQ